jgi:hypothetical protein
MKTSKKLSAGKQVAGPLCPNLAERALLGIHAQRDGHLHELAGQ